MRRTLRLRGFSCWDQFLALAFAQLTYRESLRDIEVCLRSVQPKLYHGVSSRSTLADADQAHDWRRGSPSEGDDGTDPLRKTFGKCSESFQRSGAFFVVRVKKGVQLRRRCSHPADAGAGVISDHTVVLTTERSAQHYPDTLRRVRYHDVEHDRRLSFLTNNFDLPALTVALLYKSRWKVELFFKWIKQHLRIKAFYGTSENAVKTQIWTAVSVYVLVAILKKRLGLGPSLHQILQIELMWTFSACTLITKTPMQLSSTVRRVHTAKEIP